MNNKFDPNKNIADMAAKAARQMPKQQNVNIPIETIKKGEDMKCIGQIPVIEDGKIKEGEFKICNCNIFIEAANLKYISPIISPTGQQTIATLLIGKMCVQCGKIFNPDEWLKNREEKVNAKT
jgi:hypothetical protein